MANSSQFFVGSNFAFGDFSKKCECLVHRSN